MYVYIFGGGVEDTRLDAKAKDTQKNPRPRTALPTTDPLEAKDRNARSQGLGHKRKCSPKKKGLQKNFSGDLQKRKKKVFRKLFSGAPQTFNYSKNSAVLEPRTSQFSRT